MPQSHGRQLSFLQKVRSGHPSTEVDGSIGYQILRQFVITFDYSRSEAWFERSAAFGTKTVQWKTDFQAVKANGPYFQALQSSRTRRLPPQG